MEPFAEKLLRMIYRNTKGKLFARMRLKEIVIRPDFNNKMTEYCEAAWWLRKSGYIHAKQKDDHHLPDFMWLTLKGWFYFK